MRTYGRNVRRAWDGDDCRPAKRIRVEETSNNKGIHQGSNKENSTLMIYDIEDNLERAIRETSVAALSSSPSRKNSMVFSLESHDDERTATMTPPSSPPPQLLLTPPNVKPRKPTFSFLEKQKKEKPKAQEHSLKRKHDASITAYQRDDSEPLNEIHNLARPPFSAPSNSFTSVNGQTPRAVAPPTENSDLTRSSAIPTPRPLVQAVLDFGQSLQPTTCISCNMTYTPTIASDNQLHEMYHNRHSSGIGLGKPFLKTAMKWCYEAVHIPGSVIVVDRKLSGPSRKVVARVLEVVNKELGSVDIPEDELWSQRIVPGEEDSEAKKCDRYKIFMHIFEGKCVGVCLAERICKAYKVLQPTKEREQATRTRETEDTHDASLKEEEKTLESPPTPTSTSQEHDTSLNLSKESFPAIVGVSRIWTSRSFRRKGIANNLLECVMHQFIYGMEIERTEVAFSQPTELGTALAKSWFGYGEAKAGEETQPECSEQELGNWGWRVYVEA
jgi:N-acetyltransferase